MTKKILFGLTTTEKSDWHDKSAEISELGIQEIALFPTGLAPEQRQELYKLLETTPLEAIPYVCLRADFIPEEVDYLIGRYKTKALSYQADDSATTLLTTLGRYASMIYVENPRDLKHNGFFNRETLSRSQVFGVCLDLASYEETRLKDKLNFRLLGDILGAFPVDVNHVTAFRSSAVLRMFHQTHAAHYSETLHDFDYLLGIPANYFGKYIALELENSLLEQREIIHYLELMLRGRLV